MDTTVVPGGGGPKDKDETGERQGEILSDIAASFSLNFFVNKKSVWD